MTAENEPDFKDEARLQALFDDTTTSLSDLERARLATGATATGSRRSRRLSLGVVWPAALAAAAGVVYLAVAPPRNEPAASPVTAPAAIPASAIAVAPSAVPAEPTESEPEDPVATVLGGEPEDWDPLDLGPLMKVGAPRRVAREPSSP